MKLQTPLLALFLSLPLAAAPLPHTVATDDLGTPGKQEHLLSGAPWTWKHKNAPADKTVAFGDDVVLSYGGADPATRYEIALSFSSDAPGRVVEVLADDAVLAKQIEIPHKGEITKVFPIPSSVLADGRFEVRVHRISGAKAVLCRAVVRSDKPGTLEFALRDFGTNDITLTPLPLST